MALKRASPLYTVSNINTKALPLKWKWVLIKKIIRTFFSEEFFYGSHKLIDFIKFILANFWKWENFFLKMIKHLVKMNFLQLYKVVILVEKEIDLLESISGRQDITA